MNNSFEHMQKLAFGKVVTNTEAQLRDKIRTILEEAKKKKQKDVAPQEDVDIELPTEEPAAEPTAEPAAEVPAEPTGMEAPATDINPTVKSIQDALQKAYAQAKALGDEKLATQIGNTITMLVRDQVLGGGQKAGM